MAERASCEHRMPAAAIATADPLQPGQPLLEDESAEQDVGQRIEIIAEAARRGCARC